MQANETHSSDTPALAVHGGDLDAVARRYAVPRDELVDFSANLNPLGPPRALLDELRAAAGDVGDLARYPEPDAATLRRALGAHHDIDPDSIVVANGAAAIIGVAAAVAMGERCIVPQPAFSEDAHALAAAGVALVPVALEAADDFALPMYEIARLLETRAADALLVTTPHNPSGTLVAPETLSELRERTRRASATFVIDEAFVDFVPHATTIAHAATASRTIAIRSLTKFFAVPALRVGFGVCEPELAARMRAALPSWPVTTMAMRAVIAALGDAAYARTTLVTIERNRTILRADLEALGLRTFPSAANFILIQLPIAYGAAALTRELVVASRIVVRDCSSYVGLAPDRFIRVAVRDVVNNHRLIVAMRVALARAD